MGREALAPAAGRPAPPADEGAAAEQASLALARAALVTALVLAVPIVGLAAILNGTAGAGGAASGLGLVLVLFGASALLQAWTARFSPQLWMTVVVTGFVARLGLYTLALVGLSHIEGLHWGSLVVATAVGFVGTFGVEIRVLARRPELFWVRTDRTVEGVDR